MSNSPWLTGLLALLLSTSMVSPVRALEIIGHRGCAHDAPENTLASFRLGWAQKADADELDIHLTKDGQVIVSHDANTKRTAGLDRPIVEQTMAELQALDAGVWKGIEWKGEKLPPLADVIATIPDSRRLFIEIKCGVEVLPALEKIVQASGKKPAQLVIIGFGYDVMAAAKKQFPQLAVYWIVAHRKGEPPGPAELEALVTKAKAAGLDGLDMQGTMPIDRAFVEKAKAAGLKIYTWTVDDVARAKELAAAGIDGVTTNRPGWMREQLGL